ncbi:hypothetical protein [Novacetimonas hansenii]|nr:hypothetical protein [Novacetimonas hansenii]GAN84047.1 NAD synthetase [Novacetimonas hansenii JCM 7643]GBQ55870.1 hypothetical protein AA0243_1035 [Novacetimonas hansenii NRIC 0243]
MEWILPNGLTYEDVLNYVGFVYIITNKINNKKYIGKKVVYFKRKKKIKGKTKTVTYESDWKQYYGSSDDLKIDIKHYGIQNFERKIISLHKNRSSMNYAEIEQQVKNNVLLEKDEQGNLLYYNRNILNKYYRNNIGK